ncbi:MAG: hypothetical protein V4722_07600 [Bacteroidota bacterium]
MPEFIQKCLDGIFYSTFLKVTILVIASAVLLFSVILMAKQTLKKRLRYIPFSVLSAGILYLVLFYPGRLKYGFVENFKYQIAQPNTPFIWALDEIKLSSRGNSRTRSYFRIHCIEITTGKRIFRKTLDVSTRFMGFKSDTVWFRQEIWETFLTRKSQYKNVITAYRFPFEQKLLTIDDDLLDRPGQLKNMPDRSNNEYLTFDMNRSLYRVKTIDGYYHYLSTDLKLKQSVTEPLTTSSPDQRFPSFESHGYKRSHFKNPLTGKIFNQATYINPIFLAAEKDQHFVFFLSYETVSEEFPVVNCIDNEGNPIWTKRIKSKPGFAGIYKNIFYISTNGSITGFDIQTGTVVWTNSY